MKKVITKILLLTLVLTFPLNTLHSEIRCMKPRSTLEELANSFAVFSGKVTEITYEPMPANPDLPANARVQTVKILVSEYWKSPLTKTVKLVTSKIELPDGLTRTMSEDFVFKINEEYLVYANRTNEYLQTNRCSRTKLLQTADDDLRELGQGEIITQ